MFSAIIKDLLAQKNISQKDFLKELKLGDNTFSNWERLTTDPIGNLPTSKNLLKIANYFDVSVDYLLERTTVPTVQKEKKNYSTYEQFLGMCRRKNVAPEKVFEELCISSTILVDWKNGKTPQDIGILHAVANYFEENRVSWERANPFTDDAKAEYELLQWFSTLSIYEKMKFVAKLQSSNDIAVADIPSSQKNTEVFTETISKSK